MGVQVPERGVALAIGKGRVMRQGTDVALLSFGAHLAEGLLAAEALAAQGVSVTVADARFAKPLDTDLINQLVRHHGALVTVEQGAAGGFGAQVLQYLANSGGMDHGLWMRTMTLPDRFIDQASPAAMYADAGLTVSDIVRTVTTVTSSGKRALRGLTNKKAPDTVGGPFSIRKPLRALSAHPG